MKFQAVIFYHNHQAFISSHSIPWSQEVDFEAVFLFWLPDLPKLPTPFEQHYLGNLGNPSAPKGLLFYTAACNTYCRKMGLQ